MSWYVIDTVVLVVVIGFIYSVIPNILVRWFQWRTLVHGPATKTVALTFDDGPDKQYTSRLLDVLKAFDIRATFFVIADKAAERPDIIRRMIADGHQIEVHGLTHAMVPVLGPRRSIEQVRSASALLRERYGVRTTLYRPTWGLCNIVSLIYVLRGSHRLVTWSVMVGDWRVTNPAVLLARIMKRLHPGAVIVLHDSDETWGSEKGAPLRVIELLPRLAESVRQAGYRFVTMSEWDAADEGST